MWIRVDAGIGHSVWLPGLILVGLGVGYIAGMFGVGGGFLLTPLLMLVFGVPPPVAVGSALCQKCGTSIASFLKYRHLGRGEPRIDLVMIGGSLIGVDAGTRLLSTLSHAAPLHLRNGRAIPIVNLALDLAFLISLSVIAIVTFRQAWMTRHRQEPPGDTTIPGFLVTKVHIPPYMDLPGVGLKRVSVPLLAYVGFFLGVASGLMGIGGGVLFMPVLLYGFGLSARNAAGTGVLLLFVTVSVGTIEQALQGYVSLKLAMAILIGSSIGSQLGALTTHHLPNRTLRLLFSGLVAVTALMLFWDLMRMLGSK